MDFQQVPGTPPPHLLPPISSPPSPPPSPGAGKRTFDVPTVQPVLTPPPADYQVPASKKPKVDVSRRKIIPAPLRQDAYMMRPRSTPMAPVVETLTSFRQDVEETSLPLSFLKSTYNTITSALSGESSSSGLQNRGNTCFMNAAMQTIADLLSFHGIPPEASSSGIPPRVFNQLNRESLFFYQLRTDTLNLCKKLNAINKKGTEAKTWNSESVEQLMDQFINSYVSYENAKKLSIQGAGSLSRSSILNHSQQDPQEFLDNVCEVLGLNQSTTSSLLSLTYLSLEKNDQVLTRRQHGNEDSEPERSTLLALPIPTADSWESAQQTTLDICVGQLLEKENLDIENHLEWSKDDLVQAGLLNEQDKPPVSASERVELLKSTRDTSQFTHTYTYTHTYTGTEPPRALLALAKLSQYYYTKQCAVRRSAEGKALLKNLDKKGTITVPCYHANLNEATGKYTLSDRPVQQAYKPRSIVVHIGSSASLGHYVTVQDTPDGYVVYNDSSVFQPQKTTLSKLFHKQSACGYIFAVQAVGRTATTEKPESTESTEQA